MTTLPHPPALGKPPPDDLPLPRGSPVSTHTVDVTTHPDAAGPLTALYLATRAAPVEGRANRSTRGQLVRVIGDSPDLAALLRSSTPIRVRPRAETVWEVVDCSQPDADDHADRQVIAVLAAERTTQELSQHELARRAGLSQAALGMLFGGHRGPRWSTVVRILAGLGRDLGWLHQKLKQGANNA